MTNSTTTYYTDANGKELFEIISHVPFVLGCIVKYLCRAGRKPGVSRERDLEQAAVYCDMMHASGYITNEYACEVLFNDLLDFTLWREIPNVDLLEGHILREEWVIAAAFIRGMI